MLKSLRKYKKAISLKSNFAEAHSNLGNTQKKQGRLKEAEESFRKAIVLKPNFIFSPAVYIGHKTTVSAFEKAKENSFLKSFNLEIR